MLKLNFGCSHNKFDDFLNIDNASYCNPDLMMDLENFPWPLGDDCADEIYMGHILEHVGQDLSIFKKIIQELYRVCAPDAKITILVSEPYSDNYFRDPTHCRPITAQQLYLLSVKLMRRKKETPATPLAVMWDVDFDILHVGLQLNRDFQTVATQLNIPIDANNITHYCNAIDNHTIILQAKKPAQPY